MARVPKGSSPPPTLGASDARNIEGFGVHSKFFTPKKEPTPKSGILSLGSKAPTSSARSTLKRPFPPKLPKVP